MARNEMLFIDLTIYFIMWRLRSDSRGIAALLNERENHIYLILLARIA